LRLNGSGELNEVITKLLAVQELDRKIVGIRAELAAGPAGLAREEERLEKHRHRFEDAARRAKEAGRLADRKNGEVDAIDKKIEDLSLKLNTARSNKEYEALKTEIAGHKADRELLEEEALQQWTVGDEREKEAAVEEAKVGELERALEASRAAWEAEAKDLEARLSELDQERATRTRTVPPTWLNVYDRVVDSQGVPALVPVVDQYCQGCQINISIHDVTRAWKGDQVVQCKMCNRILYAETL
jgi:predicted  nucleic acid-binding Zn-ribbon protein